MHYHAFSYRIKCVCVKDGLALSVFATQIHLSQRERPWQRDEVRVDCQGLPLWGDAELAKIEASVTKFAKFSEIQKRMFQALFLLEENFAATAKAVPLGKVA